MEDQAQMGKDQEDISNEAWRRRKARKRVGSTGNSKRKGPEGGANLVFGERGWRPVCLEYRC